MLKCPVCKISYKEEASICKKCHLLDDDIKEINTINPDNPIFKTCIPTLLKRLDKQIKLNQESQTLSSIRQLESKIQLITKGRDEDKQRIKELEKKFNTLDDRLQNRDSYQNIDPNIQNTIIYGDDSAIPIEDIQYNANNEIINQQNDRDCNNPLDPLNNFSVENNSIEYSSTLLQNQTKNFNSLEIDQQEAFEAVKNSTLHFVEKYNCDKNLFNTRATSIVIETQESMENRLAGRGEAVYLSDNNKGKYWIIEEDNSYYLVPHVKININEHNKHTIKNLFEFEESNSDYDDFKLIKPAKVFRTNSELWQLDKKGKLEFC